VYVLMMLCIVSFGRPHDINEKLVSQAVGCAWEGTAESLNSRRWYILKPIFMIGFYYVFKFYGGVITVGGVPSAKGDDIMQ